MAALPWLLAHVDDATRSAAWLFLPYILFNHVALTMLAVDHGAGRFRPYNLIRLLIYPVYLTMVVTLWLVGARSAPAYVAALAAANGVVASACLVRAACQTRGWGRLEPLADVFREGIPFAISGFAAPLLLVADKALLLYMLGETQLGFYAIALSAASVLQSLGQAADAVTFGMSAQSQGAAAFTRVARVFRMSAWCWALGGAALAAAMPLLLPLVYGHAFDPSVAPAIVLILSGALAGQAAILENAMRAQGRAFVGLEARAAGTAAFLAVGWWSAARWGLVGAAAAYAAGQALVLALMLALARHHMREVGMRSLIPRLADLKELFHRGPRMLWEFKDAGVRAVRPVRQAPSECAVAAAESKAREDVRSPAPSA
jgi:O-antigen/teichoic acid export membrane protein